jgi:hypothetical protein
MNHLVCMATHGHCERTADSPVRRLEEPLVKKEVVYLSYLVALFMNDTKL